MYKQFSNSDPHRHRHHQFFCIREDSLCGHRPQWEYSHGGMIKEVKSELGSTQLNKVNTGNLFFYI